MADNPYFDHKTEYLKVMEELKTKFDDGELSDDQKKNATDIFDSTKEMLASQSFAVLGLVRGNLSSDDTLDTIAKYRDSGNMTEEQSKQLSQLAEDTHVRMINCLLTPPSPRSSSQTFSSVACVHGARCSVLCECPRWSAARLARSWSLSSGSRSAAAAGPGHPAPQCHHSWWTQRTSDSSSDAQ